MKTSRLSGIVRADPAADRIDVPRLATVAVLSLLAGVAVAALLSPPRGQHAATTHENAHPDPSLADPDPVPNPTADHVPAPAADPIAADHEPAPPADPVPVPAADPAPPENPVPVPAADPASAADPAPADASMQQGHVAYLRCEGVPQQPGRFPCPRDRALEATAWEALRGLEHCADAGLGSGEVRLGFSSNDPPSLRIRRRSGGSLNVAAVERCVGARLRQAHTVLDPIDMIVSFRFDLR